jgi:hypothetical protein
LLQAREEDMMEWDETLPDVEMPAILAVRPPPGAAANYLDMEPDEVSIARRHPVILLREGCPSDDKADLDPRTLTRMMLIASLTIVTSTRLLGM